MRWPIADAGVHPSYRVSPHKLGCPASYDVEATCGCLRHVMRTLPFITEEDAYRTWSPGMVLILEQQRKLIRLRDGRFFVSQHMHRRRA